jgi:hypothetical protein
MKKDIGFVLMLTLVIWSCKKNSGSPNNAEVLQSHSWYPYQTEIIITDTTTVTPRGVGNTPPVITTQSFDTVITLEPCLEQSAFTFLQNGSMHISNACRAIGYDTLWSVTNNVLLSSTSVTSDLVQNFYLEHFPILFLYSNPDTTHFYVSSRGNIIAIDNTHFIFNNAVVNATFDFANSSADTLRMITGKELTTYKARL